MVKQSIRVAPPSPEANNQDVFVWALYLLGGADRVVDVEAVYLKSFDLAPARLGWRTKPELPDYKKTAKALQSVEATTHVGLVHKVGPYTRRLTADGAAWIERYRKILETTYSLGKNVSAPKGSNLDHKRSAIKSSVAFSHWLANEPVEIADLADAFECSPASPQRVWKGRVEELRRVADVTKDPELGGFSRYIDIYLQENLEGWV